jgi:putative two-component system response regulator
MTTTPCDTEIGAHTERMAIAASRMAALYGFDAHMFRVAAALHDVGKLWISQSILSKEGPLTPTERRKMEEHARIGHDILSSSHSDLMKLASEIALTHHERWDGTGYPNRLAGTDIPLAGRIAAIADVWDALTTDRCYRPAFSPDEARTIMRAQRGHYFDPELLDLFLSIV